MNKKKIVDNVIKSLKLSVEDKEIINAIDVAKMDWENAEKFFQFVKEPEMVDYAIYLEKAACARYMHLLNLAKDKKINSNYYSYMQELDIK